VRDRCAEGGVVPVPAVQQREGQFLGNDGVLSATSWRSERPSPGTPLRTPEPLFPKIEVEAEPA
jgi:hypothetical protein